MKHLLYILCLFVLSCDSGGDCILESDFMGCNTQISYVLTYTGLIGEDTGEECCGIDMTTEWPYNIESYNAMMGGETILIFNSDGSGFIETPYFCHWDIENLDNQPQTQEDCITAHTELIENSENHPDIVNPTIFWSGGIYNMTWVADENIVNIEDLDEFGILSGEFTLSDNNTLLTSTFEICSVTGSYTSCSILANRIYTLNI